MDASTLINPADTVICPNCGTSLSYKPGTTNMVCEHCASSFEIKTDAASIAVAQKENDLSTALASDWQTFQQQVQALVVKCPICNTQSATEKDKFSGECPFCGSPLTVQPEERPVAQPQAFLPFKLEKDKAINWFYEWLHEQRLAPSDLKKSVSYDHFNGVYLPFWTFDADTTTTYTGEIGHHYTTTRKNSKGETVRGTQTRWSAASGQVSSSFNDILVTASRALPKKFLNDLEPWDLANLIPYDYRYLSGFRTEVSQVDLAAGFEQAKQVMEEKIEKDIRYDIGGDEQRIHKKSTNYDRTTYKYILLPVWLNVYRYKDQAYHFLVNARTGELHGDRPYSTGKVSLLVLAVLVLIIGLVVVYWIATGHH
jgi:uncharacterized CHY-type Zn-finger protein